MSRFSASKGIMYSAPPDPEGESGSDENAEPTAETAADEVAAAALGDD